MSASAFAISRRLAERGVDKKTADAVAEEIITHTDENHATKADIVRLEGKIESLAVRMEGKIETLASQIKILTALVVGLYIGLALLVTDRL